MSDRPSITFIFCPVKWKLLKVYHNGATDEQTAKLREIADKMLKSIEGADEG